MSELFHHTEFEDPADTPAEPLSRPLSAQTRNHLSRFVGSMPGMQELLDESDSLQNTPDTIK